jgi:dolichol-phosphate mannosyltransferase
MSKQMDLSVVMLSFNEAENLKVLIPQIRAVVRPLSLEYEILVLDGNSSDNTVSVAGSSGCRVVMQDKPGYGSAFKQAMREVRGSYAITLDADCSHAPEFIKKLWEERERCQLVIASRYIKGGSADMPMTRRFLSVILNRVYAAALALPYKDLSSGFRLYEMNSLRGVLGRLSARDFDVLIEVLLEMHRDGFHVAEIPFYYQPRNHGRSTARIWKFGVSYIKTLYRLWRVGNSKIAGKS